LAYTVEVAPAARRQIRKLDRELQRRILLALEGLQDDPRSTSAIKLHGSDDLYRLRVGDYRIVYAIQDARLMVLVVKVGHRRDVYRDR
jgi:mRNA interferase RelE/StbE